MKHFDVDTDRVVAGVDVTRMGLAGDEAPVDPRPTTASGLQRLERSPTAGEEESAPVRRSERLDDLGPRRMPLPGRQHTIDKPRDHQHNIPVVSTEIDNHAPRVGQDLPGSDPATVQKCRSRRNHPIAVQLLAAAALAGSAGLLAACGGSSTPDASPTTTASSDSTGMSTPSAAAGQVLPIDTNPITNPATAQAFTIDSVLVENNEDGNGNAVDDHLEITLTNTSNTDLNGFEVFYTYDDPTDGISESYYAQLPADFTVASGATRVVHFDNTGATDHFPVNAFSLYYTDVNALDVTVEVSATDAAPQTATVQRDAGGAEVPD